MAYNFVVMFLRPILRNLFFAEFLNFDFVSELSAILDTYNVFLSQSKKYTMITGQQFRKKVQIQKSKKVDFLIRLIQRT